MLYPPFHATDPASHAPPARLQRECEEVSAAVQAGELHLQSASVTAHWGSNQIRATIQKTGQLAFERATFGL